MAEWKNILLRGSDQQDYQTYLNQFEQREATARLDELAENLSHRSKEVLQEATVSSEQLYASLRTALQIISGIAIILTVALAVIKSRA